MATEVPHFKWPFKWDNVSKHFGVNEQDTLDDVIACVIVALLVEPGTRVEVPSYGVPSQVFEMQPLNLPLMISAVELWENRAQQLMNQQVNVQDNLIANITDIVSLRGAGGQT